MQKLHQMNGRLCSCGKVHNFSSEILIGSGTISNLPKQIERLGAKKAFVLSDQNTYKAAGKTVCEILSHNNIPQNNHILENPVPNEHFVGSAIMHYTSDCDVVIGVGSGCINDLGKMVAAISNKPYIIVGTAPSMDGYASATSSVVRDGLKISMPSKSADVIIGDIDILRTAPHALMQAGLGDMIAKYISIAEWRISHIINGEYYCEEVADLVRGALDRCIQNKDGLLRGDSAAIRAVFEGLVITGIAMNYAGVSRPASGTEHYISHILSMRALEFGTAETLHGIECAIGTLISARLYEKVRELKPDREKAYLYTEQFSVALWSETLRSFLGRGADEMIALEKREKKYDLESHRVRLENILHNWDEILSVINEEIPSSAWIEQCLKSVQAPTSLSQIGVNEADLPTILSVTKDIRDKYILTRLLWDLGESDILMTP